MTPITILFVVIVALLAGMEGILDQWIHQPLVACSLIGLAGHPAGRDHPRRFSSEDCSGWAVGAAVAPDAALHLLHPQLLWFFN